MPEKMSVDSQLISCRVQNFGATADEIDECLGDTFPRPGRQHNKAPSQNIVPILVELPSKKRLQCCHGSRCPGKTQLMSFGEEKSTSLPVSNLVTALRAYAK